MFMVAQIGPVVMVNSSAIKSSGFNLLAQKVVAFEKDGYCLRNELTRLTSAVIRINESLSAINITI